MDGWLTALVEGADPVVLFLDDAGHGIAIEVGVVSSGAGVPIALTFEDIAVGRAAEEIGGELPDVFGDGAVGGVGEVTRRHGRVADGAIQVPEDPVFDHGLVGTFGGDAGSEMR